MDDERRRQLANRVVTARDIAEALEAMPLPTPHQIGWARCCRHYAEDVGELLAQ